MRGESTTNRFEVMQAAFPRISGLVSLTAKLRLRKSVAVSIGWKPNDDRRKPHRHEAGRGGLTRRVIKIKYSTNESVGGSQRLRGAASRAVALGAAVAALALLGGPAAAWAQGDPTADQYDPTITQIQTETGSGGGGGSTPSDPIGPLPFTGFDIGALIAVAAALLLLGIVLYRRGSRLGEGDAAP